MARHDVILAWVRMHAKQCASYIPRDRALTMRRCFTSDQGSRAEMFERRSFSAGALSCQTSAHASV